MSDIDDDDYGYDGLDDGLDEDLDDDLDDGLDDDVDDGLGEGSEVGQDDETDDVLEVPGDTGLVDVKGDPVAEAELEAAEQAIPEGDQGIDDGLEVPAGNGEELEVPPEEDGGQDDLEESSTGPTYTGDFREGYEMSGRGTNEQGNHWDSRDYGPDAPNQNSYHYSNR